VKQAHDAAFPFFPYIEIEQRFSNMDKMRQLETYIQQLEKVIVGYSGGVDSTLVAYVAHKVLGSHALIVLATTETITQEDIELARTIARTYQFNIREIAYSELAIKDYASNPVNRCYFCKQELYTQLRRIADEEHIQHILDGANLDDVSDYRPGRIAAKEQNVHSPLIEVQCTKAEVREVAKLYGLPNFDKPAAPCLSSRIPYGTFIDATSLAMVAQAERYIRQKGFQNVRVRHFGSTAKIEVDSWAIEKLTGIFADIERFIRSLGYREVIIDHEGFASGKLNREIMKNEI